MMISPTVIQQTYKVICTASSPVAVLLFAHGLERFSTTAETPTQAAQLQRTLQEFSKHLVGIYDQQVSLADFRDDIHFAQEQLSYGAID